ncbi:MAG: hypothetical protein FWG34_07935 [Oscillospiraceae bacterium]|nr:hypothetical protein [Oscillospiraceae bacterium]
MRNNKLAKKLFGLALALICVFANFAAVGASAAPNYFVPNNPDFTSVQSGIPSKSAQNYYLSNWNDVPNLQTIVNADGTISVLDAENATIYEYSANAEFIRTQAFKKELAKVGAFAKDKNGNYYIFYAKDVAEGAFGEKNMVLVKYSPSGSKSREFWLEAQGADGYFSGVKVPFSFGSCKMEISGEMIAVYFGRQMFVSNDGKNHQASYGFVLNLETFEHLTTGNKKSIPYSSHSFNQFILPVENGFVFADHGDAYPRAFAFEFVDFSGEPENSWKQNNNKQIESFKFAGESGDNYTGAEMGGLAKTPGGYMFAGTYDKKNPAAAGSRNLFLLVMDENLTEISDPIWITNYADKNTEHAVAPKIVKIDAAKYLLLWAMHDPGARNAGKTYMALVNEKGELTAPVREIPGVSLNRSDVLRCSPKTRLVHWAAIDPEGKIVLYSLDPLAEPNYAPPLPIGAKIGDVVHSDITAYINGHEIPTRAANGKTLVAVDDLARYGFDVVWDGIAKTLKVELGNGKAFNAITVEKNADKPGAFRGTYVYTGIKTYLSGKIVGCVSIEGQIYIDFESLKKYGALSWNGLNRELRLAIGT